jgi:signal transduction histidine kinase
VPRRDDAAGGCARAPRLGGRLGILAIKLDQLRLNNSSMPPAMLSAFEELRQQNTEITDDIHGLSHRLHSSMLDHLGMVPALQRLVKECSERYAIPVAFAHDTLQNPVPSDIASCLFRVVEEGLTNIARHSQAPSARVEVGSDEQGIRLTISDDGVGFDPGVLEQRAGLGFVSMRERLRLVHGTIRVRSGQAEGTNIVVRVPSNGEPVG